MTEVAHRAFAKSAHPVNWYEVAKLMHENAHTLHASPQGVVSYFDGVRMITRRTSNRSVFLLAAFALENLVKAFLIYENPRYVEGGRLARQLLNGHGLSKLQQACRKIPSPQRTRHIFETLEVGVNSWARYPCSTSSERETEERTVTPQFWSEYNRVFDMYSQRLETLLSKQWRGHYGEVSRITFEERGSGA